MAKLKSEIRQDYFLNKYVIITPGRSQRPRDIKEETNITRDSECFFCPENIKSNLIVDKIGPAKKWHAISIKNIYPAVSPDNKNAYGYQEVIIDTPNHNQEMGDLSIEQIKNILNLYSKRTKAISKDKKIDYILCFKNQGSKAGASKAHAHSQIFATAILPPEIEEELHIAHEYEKELGVCPYCKIAKSEGQSERKIFSDKNIVAIAPFASQFHYEAWIFTKRHLDNITSLNQDEINSLAKAIKKITSKLKELDLSFNFFLHQVISDSNQHFCLKIQPRNSIWGGVELGSGLVINSVSPEEAAKFYRS